MNKTGNLICIVVALAIFCGCLPTAWAVETQQIIEDGFTYSISGGEAVVTAYTGSETDVTVPTSVQGYAVVAIGTNAFKRTPVKNVILSEGIRDIEEQAFCACSDLESIQFPESLVTVGEMSFDLCVSLKSVELPKNVRSIGTAAFSNCVGLESLRISEENPYFTVRDSVIFSKDGKELLFFYNFVDTAYTVPADVQVIGERAFAYHNKIRQVTLPAGLKTIGSYAFSGCVDLQSIQIPDSVNHLGSFAFRGCSELKEVTVGAGVTVVSSYSFNNCTSLTLVQLSEGVQKIQDRAFYGCGTIQTLAVPDSLTQISETAFGRTQINTVRFYSLQQKETMEDLFAGSQLVCLCSGEHTYLPQQPDKCSVCGYTRDLKTPPVLLSVTSDTVKLLAQAGFEYSYDKENWRTDGVFTALAPCATYRFYSRPVGTGAMSDPLQVTTLMGTHPKAAKPEIEKITDDSVTLKTVAGCEYSMDGVSWQASPVFAGLEPEKTYLFYQRMAQTATHYAGEVSDPVSAKPLGVSALTSTVYRVQDQTIGKIPAGTDVSTLLAGLVGGQYCRVMKGTEQVTGSTAVGTGMTVQLLSGGNVKMTYTIVVTGDTNGDGQTSITDMIAVKAHLLGKTALTGASVQAADTNGDGKITITDFIQIKAKLLGKGIITPQ